ncbi:MAG: DUF1638 domain-containing protein [Planctomycetaceae bacterium]|jgi:hypothetical protein|nr:DUF1638 domain-containing protein [Planctomycetaceae bacterium]
MRLKLIACEIFFREINFVVSFSPHAVDVEFLGKGLHDLGKDGMFNNLSAALERVESDKYDAVLLGYGLCNGGVVGLRAKKIPIVIPRVHDCITLFMGDRKKYAEYFAKNEGVYFQTTGWIERGGELTQKTPDSITTKLGVNLSKNELIERYGKKNAEFLRQKLDGLKHYSKITFIEMGIEPDDSFENIAKLDAQKKQIMFEKIKGDLILLKNLVNGNWNKEDFLIIKPNAKIIHSYNENIIETQE